LIVFVITYSESASIDSNGSGEWGYINLDLPIAPGGNRYYSDIPSMQYASIKKDF